MLWPAANDTLWKVLGSCLLQNLDFDFEKCCVVSLSPINVYACLVCGKYFQVINHLGAMPYSLCRDLALSLVLSALFIA